MARSGLRVGEAVKKTPWFIGAIHRGDSLGYTRHKESDYADT
ncbi:hypothetical protein [Armatimonas sp.]